jgi:hypothetical protein
MADDGRQDVQQARCGLLGSCRQGDGTPVLGTAASARPGPAAGQEYGPPLIEGTINAP